MAFITLRVACHLLICHSSFVICHLSFVLAVGRPTSNTNDKGPMTNDPFDKHSRAPRGLLAAPGGFFPPRKKSVRENRVDSGGELIIVRAAVEDRVAAVVEANLRTDL